MRLHRYYRETFGYQSGPLPNAAWGSDRALSLPLSPKLSDDDVEGVVFAVRQTLEHFARPQMEAVEIGVEQQLTSLCSRSGA